MLFKVALAMLTLRVTTLTDLDEHGPIFNALSEIPVGTQINLFVFLLLSPENLLENTDGELHHCSLSRGGSLLPSIHADARSPDDVIAF